MPEKTRDAINTKKILILTADAGFGHRSAANAVSEALSKLYDHEVEALIINPLDNEHAPTFLRESQADYDKWVKDAPELYQFGYNASDALVPTQIMERYLGVALDDVMREIFIEYKPDTVLTTYPMYQSAVTNLFRNKKYRVPFFTVITDLATVHRLWFHRKVDGLMVPNQFVADLAMSYQVRPSKISITGIPVSPAISEETRSKTEIRKELGWQTEIPTLLAVGSRRVDRLIDALNVVNHYGGEIQIVVVTGNDEELHQELNRFDWHIPAHIYGFVENIPSMMRAADLIICKAGGLIVTESLASGLPMILIEVIPGQETGNAEYVTSHGAADIAESPVEILEAIHHLLKNNFSLLKKRAENACKIGLDQSAFVVAKKLWNAAQKGAAPKTSRRTKSLETPRSG